MENLKQISVIQKALEKQKEKQLAELSKIKQFILKKQAALHKILDYHNDYYDPNKHGISHARPALAKNLEGFAERLKEIIAAEEAEIAKYQVIENTYLTKLNEIEKKINFLTDTAQKINAKKVYKLERRQQLTMDDLAAIRKFEEANE